MSDAVRPYRIAVPDAALEVLRDKLEAAAYAPAADFADDWASGAPLSEVRRLADYWRDGFDWRRHEARLNALPHFATRVPVDGFGELDVHFLHQRSSRPDSIPLLFCHGWPGSFLEAVKILPLLTEPKEEEGAPSFHLVAPSLPNFGFSQAVSRRGFGLAQYAECAHRLMLKLGYDRYVTQGGDWGAIITRIIGLRYPDHCLASHVNFLVVRPPLWQAAWLGLRHWLGWSSARERAGLARSAWYLAEGSGYMLLQSTKPATLAFALADSPVALLAWVYEKLHDWTDGYRWTDDEVLTWVSVYRFSAAGPAASLRIYYEAFHADFRGSLFAAGGYVPGVPLGVSHYPKDLLAPPRAVASASGPVVFEAVHDEGGHFAAYERPDLFAADLRAMFGTGGGACDVARRFRSGS
ncbi:hypothetical protein CDD83_7131 [Cordyceps sp. RAO-2017]|nr:hypothetical protein CDD83_7131 [Cordyceps sp. RAO-2017]